MKRGRYFAAAAIAVAAVVIAAALSACQTFRPDVTIGSLPEHVTSVRVSSDGDYPAAYVGKYYLFESGDTVTVEVWLEPYYEWGDMRMLVNGTAVEREKLGTGVNNNVYTYDFDIHFDCEITFEGSPVPSARTVTFATSGGDTQMQSQLRLTIEDAAKYGLNEEYTFDEVASGAVSFPISQSESFSFRLFSSEYRYMPDESAIDKTSQASFTSLQPFVDDRGNGGIYCTVAAGASTARIVLSARPAVPELVAEFDADGAIFTATVGGEIPSPEFPADVLINDPVLELALSEIGGSLCENMTANGVPLAVTVNGTEISEDGLSIAEKDGKTVISLRLAPAYTYADGATNGLFSYTVALNVSEYAASDPSLTARMPADRKVTATWLGERPSVTLAQDQSALIWISDEGDRYFLNGSYVVFDALVPVGVSGGIPSYDFTFDGTIRDIYDASGSDAFAADDSDVKIARTDTEMRDPENSGLWLRLYKIYVKSEYIAQNDVAVAFGV